MNNCFNVNKKVPLADIFTYNKPFVIHYHNDTEVSL